MGNGNPLRLLVIGAHPDDCEMRAAGLSKRWIDRGGQVGWLSITDGAAGHQTLSGGELVRIRQKESEAAAALIGATCFNLGIADGKVIPSLEHRESLIRFIRDFQPDVIAGPRIWDYHPDHRYTAQLLQDALYLIQVPNIVPVSPAMRHAPLVLSVWDQFRTPAPIRPDLLFDIDDMVELKAQVIAQHHSQVFDWIPWIGQFQDKLPADLAADGAAFIRDFYLPHLGSDPEPFRQELIKRYGAERGASIRFVEVFEVSEHGAPLTPQLREALFPY